MSTANVLLLLPETENGNDQYGVALRAKFPQLRIDWARNAAEAAPYLPDANVLLTFSPFMSPGIAAQAKNLRWVQVLGSGVDGVLDLAYAQPVVITNGRGVQAAPVAEATLALMLAQARRVPTMVRNQDAGKWERWPSQLLYDKTVCIVGVGQIAEGLAVRCQAFGMKVTGVSSRPGAPAGFTTMFAKTDLLKAAGEADFLVILTPYTPETRHSIGAAVFAAMKPAAYLVNVARGGVVDETALVAALDKGAIAGAALDVFEVHPLAPDSPLWKHPKVIVSPHLAGLNDAYCRHIMPLLETNFAHFLNDAPHAMKNVVKFPTAN